MKLGVKNIKKARSFVLLAFLYSIYAQILFIFYKHGGISFLAALNCSTPMETCQTVL